MARTTTSELFSVDGLRVAVTGGAGVLCGDMCRHLGAVGASVAVLDLAEDRAAEVAKAVTADGGKAISLGCDVLDKDNVTAACAKVVDAFGGVDAVINGAGGNHPTATTRPDQSFFDLSGDAFDRVFNLNFKGTLIPAQVFGKVMADAGRGNILNVSSMNAFRPLTNIPAYSAAKAAVTNFTQWLAVHMAHNYSKEIRVNGIAPGFLLTDQNRYLLTDKETGEMTPRGQSIIDHTPIGRYGTGEDLLGTVQWLLSPASAFITGAVVPIDGGFLAFGGV